MSWKNSCQPVFLSVQARIRSANPKQEAAMIEERVTITSRKLHDRACTKPGPSRLCAVSIYNNLEYLEVAERLLEDRRMGSIPPGMPMLLSTCLAFLGLVRLLARMNHHGNTCRISAATYPLNELPTCSQIHLDCSTQAIFRSTPI